MGEQCELRSQDAMTPAECELCALHDETLARLQRERLFALYALGVRIHRFQQSQPRGGRAIERCARRVQVDRTTLLRYAYIAGRLSEEEFASLVALSDSRGYPATIWDIARALRLSREERRNALRRTLAERAQKAGRRKGRLAEEPATVD